MITIVNSILTIYSWTIVCVLLYFLLAIARFYQEKSGQRSYFALYLIPMALFAIAALRYAWLNDLIIGDVPGDAMRFTAGVILISAGYFLLKLMIGRRS